MERSISASSFTGRLQESMKVLVMHDKLYCRGCVKKFVNKWATVFLYDFGIISLHWFIYFYYIYEKIYEIFQYSFLSFEGKEVEVKYEDLKQMDKTVEDFPKTLISASLMHHERISKEEPFDKVVEIMKKHAANETVFNCVNIILHKTLFVLFRNNTVHEKNVLLIGGNLNMHLMK